MNALSAGLVRSGETQRLDHVRATVVWPDAHRRRQPAEGVNDREDAGLTQRDLVGGRSPRREDARIVRRQIADVEAHLLS